MLVLTVHVKVKPGRREEFIGIIREDAENTTSKEDGNFQFSVIQDQSDPDRFSLFEVYRDEEALEVHRSMPHFLKYRAATEDIYAEGPERHIGNSLFPADSYWVS